MSKTLYFSHAIFPKFNKPNRDGRARKKKYCSSTAALKINFEHFVIQNKNDFEKTLFTSLRRLLEFLEYLDSVILNYGNLIG